MQVAVYLVLNRKCVPELGPESYQKKNQIKNLN